ncbi:MAG: glycosyltransferase family 4 protein [Candidatus Cloacimonetes bacterium]|nr:glycosyltransferase family 4 protein [Candidatus Cloacimonadota bacterium]NLO12237.1 glycosyltransferase family 4 protein [Candidatus Cloacimonadota bacterium]
MCVRRQKLLLISDLYPTPENSVSGIFVKHQVQALRSFYDITVLATHFPGNPCIRMEQTPEYRVIYVNFPQSRLLFPLTALHYRKWVLPQLKKLLKEWQPDLIQVHDCRHIPELLCLSSVLRDVPIRKILTLHNIKTLPELGEHLYLRQLYKYTLKRAFSIWDKVLFVNKAQKLRMEEIIPADKSVFIGNAIHPATACEDPFIRQTAESLQPDEFNILTVGNLTATKGFDILINAVAQMREQGKAVTLWIVGDGAQRENLSKLILDLDLQRQVHMVLAKSNEIVRQLYPLFDLFALPSYSESFGIVYVEAMEAGIPVIGVRGQGIDGVVIDGENGLLCQPKDQASLHEKISWVMEHPEAAKEMAKKGQTTVKEQYMMDDLIQRLRDIYEE